MKEKTERIQNPSPQVAAAYAEEDGNYREAARLYKQAGDTAGGHTHAANMYAAEKRCTEKAAVKNDPNDNYAMHEKDREAKRKAQSAGSDHTPSATAEKSAHTPGPWHVSEGTNDLGIYPNAGKIIAVVKDKNANTANARLIAAAPELLEVALALVGAPPKYGRDGIATLSTREVVEKARAAIAKAEGGK